MTNISQVNLTGRKRWISLRITIYTVLITLAASFIPTPQADAGSQMKSALSLPASIPGAGPTDPDEFMAFMDPLIADLMEANHIPGGAIAVVKDGQLFFARGYGFADLERRTLATADTTIFRTGSISKVLTWTAVMQLVEQGKLDLNADVNTYLTHFQIPATFAQPITLAQLMTHTAGFEEQISNGTMYASADKYLHLQDFLAEKMPARIFPPGQVVAYSNYGAALAGEIVAEVSGEPFDQYMANHILGPLEMNRSTFIQPLPAGLAQDAAQSYSINDKNQPQVGPFEFVQAQPAGALSASAIDIAHFMIAHLQDGQFGDQRILQPESAQDMRRQYYTFNPQLPGLTRGFVEGYRNKHRLVFHPGSTDRSSSLLALLPDQKVGIFITFNSYISNSKRMALLNTLLDQYYPDSAPSTVGQPADFTASDAAGFTGSYLRSRHAETTIDSLTSALSVVAVKSNPDGTLRIDAFRDREDTPIRWVPIAPMVFQETGGQSLIAFQENPQGLVSAMFHSDQPIMVFQKLAWYQNPLTQLVGLGLVLLVFLTTFVIWPVSALQRLLRGNQISGTPLERWARFMAGGLILLNLVIVGFVGSVLIGDDSILQFGYPVGLMVAGVLAVISGIGAVVLLAFTASAWRQRSWGIVGRLHYTLVAALALYFVFYLYEINILQVQFP